MTGLTIKTDLNDITLNTNRIRRNHIMVSKLTKLSAATLLALGASAASAERWIIKGGDGDVAKMKGNSGKMHVQGNNWIAADLSDLNKGQLKKLGYTLEADLKRQLMSFSDDAGDPTMTQLTPYALYQSQAVGTDANGDAYPSLNMASAKKVCVIDSGIAGGDGDTGGKNDDFDWTNISGGTDSGTGNALTDGGPHGTHVAGTVAAADNGFGVVGFAPGNPMHIVKVFNASGWGYSSDLAHAAQECADNNADIITMSLGGGGANSTEENAFKSFTANGGLVLAAAGNDGNTTRSYPAGYSSVMMIGANDANGDIASFSQFPPTTVTTTTGRGKNRTTTTTTDETVGVEVTVGGVGTLSTYPSGGTTFTSATADGVGFTAAESDNNGSLNGATYHMGTAEATDSLANGKICTIDRGNISFVDKINNCHASGGIGAVVINNIAGEGPVYMDVTGAASIPSYGAPFESRSDIMGAGNITISSATSDYGYMDGTSMATPGAAGAAALIWSNHPTCTGTEIRDAMKASAQDGGTTGHDDYFGHGIVQAADASAYITANGCAGATDPTDPTDPGTGDLAADGSRSKGGRTLNVNWSGFSSSNVSVSVDGQLFTEANDGSSSYTGASKNATYTIKVCEEDGTTCAPTFSL